MPPASGSEAAAVARSAVGVVGPLASRTPMTTLPVAAARRSCRVARVRLRVHHRLRPLRGETDDDALADLCSYAGDKEVGPELGSWSICPTSKTFKQEFGSPAEHLATGIRTAKALGSRAFRVIPEFVGVNFDSRNAMVWRTPEGVAVQWTAMSEDRSGIPTRRTRAEHRLLPQHARPRPARVGVTSAGRRTRPACSPRRRRACCRR